MSHFFELLNQERTYSIDLKSLEYHFIEAQKQAHPDNCLGNSDAHYQSAQINQAYKILKDPFKRAVYYLSLYGIELDEKEAVAPSFLMQQMEIRERLEEADTSEIKAEIYEEIRSEINQKYQLITTLLKNPASELHLDNLKLAAKALKELRFWIVLEASSHTSKL